MQFLIKFINFASILTKNYQLIMKKTVLLVCLFLSVINISAQNPYLPMWEFIPDGEPYVFEDPDRPGHYRAYIYGSHDKLVTEYCGRDQVLWSADVSDLTHWRYEGVVFESKKNALGQNLHENGQGDVLYAPDIALKTEKDGSKTYYLYPNNQGQRNPQIARSSRPDGPFEVCNWSKDDPNSVVGLLGFDPAVFVDDDGRVYGYWGYERSYGAELDPETMCTLKEGTSIVEDMIPGCRQDDKFRFFEASSMRKIKDKYVMVYSRWTKDGDFGLPESNYTLAYCWSNSPLGPFTYGGTIIDARARQKQADGTTIVTATPNGNTHGSICEINGKWWVFFHRQGGTNEYSRQAMVASIDVDVKEGPNGYVRISEGEYTSEGFMTEGLNPEKRYPAGIACYFVGPEPAHAEYPNVIYPGSHTEIYRAEYDGVSDPYDLSINRCSMVNNVNGSVIGYKYFNMNRMSKLKNPVMYIGYTPEGIDGEIDVMLDDPEVSNGGKYLGTFSIRGEGEPATYRGHSLALKGLKKVKGKHALYLKFRSASPGSICKLHDIQLSHFVLH